MSQHPELAVLRGDLSVAGSGSNSDAEVEMASRQVISEDLERTTREVISEDRGSWGTIKPLTNLQPPLMHTSHIARVCRLAGSCDGPGYALQARHASGLAARGEIRRAAGRVSSGTGNPVCA